VLCVGDSFTFGIGTTAGAHSYPASLQRALAARPDGPWAVVNEGWPGRNSRDLLENLAAQLQRHTPAVVCILVGVNDTWSRPSLLPEGAEDAGRDDRGLRLRFRTGRLLTLCYAALTGREPAAVAPPSPVGSWAMIHRRIDFAADGSGSLDGQPMTWQQRGPWLEVRCPGHFHVVAHVEGDARALRLVPADAGASEIALQRLADMVDARIAAARRAVAEDNRGFAPTLLQPVLAATTDRDPWAPRLRRAALEIAAAVGDEAGQRTHGEWLRAHGEAAAGAEPAAPAAAPLQGVLGEHLRRAVALCRRHGAAPILVTYPYEWDIHAAHARVAAELGVALVETDAAFAARRTAEPSVDLFVTDGHCNDAGYRLLAQLVAVAVGAALDGR
jgi:lysophospholipase L1-like esterase